MTDYYSAKHWAEKARKQAIGNSTENPEGSAKYWAQQAAASAGSVNIPTPTVADAGKTLLTDGTQSSWGHDSTKQDVLTAAQLAAVNSGITADDDYIIEKGTDSAGQTYLKFKSGVLMIYFVGTSVTGLSATYNWVVPFVAAPTVVGCLGNAGLLPAEWYEQTVNVGASSAQFNWRQTSGGGYVYIIAFGSWK